MFYWYAQVMRRYVGFGGRARRREFWSFALVNFAIVLVLAFGAGLTGGITNVGGHPNFTPGSSIFYGLYVLYTLAVLIPSLAVSVRRLHDTGRSGFWLLLAFVPIIGGLVLLVFYALDSQPGENQYGPNPKFTGAQQSQSQSQGAYLYRPPQ